MSLPFTECVQVLYLTHSLEAWGYFSLTFSEQNILSKNNIINTWLSYIQVMGINGREDSSRLGLAGSLIKGAEG